MMIALRNKQTLAILVLIVLSLLLAAVVLFSVAHIHIGETFNIKPNIIMPWY